MRFAQETTAHHPAHPPRFTRYTQGTSLVWVRLGHFRLGQVVRLSSGSRSLHIHQLHITNTVSEYFQDFHTLSSFQNLIFRKILIYLIHYLSKFFILTKLLPGDVSKHPKFSISQKLFITSGNFSLHMPFNFQKYLQIRNFSHLPKFRCFSNVSGFVSFRYLEH